MTEEQILEGNKLIAAFMGCYKRTVTWVGETYERWGFTYTDISGCWDERNFDIETPYHTSWEWLMPAVDKIHHLKTWNENKQKLSMFSTLSFGIYWDRHSNDCTAHIVGSVTYCHTDSIPYTYTKVECPDIWVWHKKTAIDAAWEVVVEFIKWFNSLDTVAVSDTIEAASSTPADNLNH